MGWVRDMFVPPPRQWWNLRDDIRDGKITLDSARDPPFKPVITAEQFVKDWRYVARVCNIETSDVKPNV